MTNKEILQADLLDILFEHRNKLYGAYALRRTYARRLSLALGVALSIVLLLIIMSFIKNDTGNSKPINDDRSVILTDINLPDEEIKKPEPLRDEPRPQTARADHQQIIVVPDNEADEIPEQETISRSEVSNVNTDGNPADDLVKTKPDPEGNGNVPIKEVEKNDAPILPSHGPVFPGGTEAWLSFLQRYLQSPEDLEPGQRIEVQVRFWIDVDGKISKPEIIKSGGSSFDKEVLRVMKKMPRWEPAMQNGNFIAVPYTQPVIFLGVEQ